MAKSYRELQHMWQAQANGTKDPRDKRRWQGQADNFKWLADELEKQSK
jgi:hypothetical protein